MKFYKLWQISPLYFIPTLKRELLFSMSSTDVYALAPVPLRFSNLRVCGNQSDPTRLRRRRARTAPAELGTMDLSLLPAPRTPPPPTETPPIIIAPRQSIYHQLSPLKPQRPAPPVPQPPSPSNVFNAERYKHLPLPVVPSPPPQNLINLPIQALSGIAVTSSNSTTNSDHSPLSHSQTIRGTLRSMSKTRNWAIQCGVKDDKKLQICKKSRLANTCWCESTNPMEDFQAYADYVDDNIKKEQFCELSIGMCVADKFLFYALTRFPRWRLVYVHIDSGVECVEMLCERTHLLNFFEVPPHQVPQSPRFMRQN